MKFSEMVNNQRTRNAVAKYKLEEDRYKEGSWYPEWRPSDEIFYTMYEDGFRYDHSGGEPLYPGSWEKGFRTLEEACIYTVKYFQNHRNSGTRANDLHVVQINGTIYGSEDAEEPEDYEGDWYSYAKVRNIAKRASNIPDADESYDASAKKSQSSVKKYSGHQIAEDLFTRSTIDVYGLGYECEVQSQGYDLTGKHRTYRLWWSHYDDLFWDIRVRNHGESFDLNYVPGINYSHERMDNVSWDTIAEVIKGDIDLWYKMGIVEKNLRKSPYNSDDYQRIIERLQRVKRELDSIDQVLYVNITEPDYIKKMELLQDTLEDIIVLVESKKKH